MSVPFVFHTHTLTQLRLDEAIEVNVPIEVDISIDNGELYIGHPLAYYEFHHETRPELITIDELQQRLVQTDIPVVFDVKDCNAVDKVIDFIQTVDPSRCYVHLFAEALVFDPSETLAEPHRANENIPTELIRDIKQSLSVPIIASARGANASFVQPDWIIAGLEEIHSYIDIFNGNVDYQTYPPEVLHYLADTRIEVLINLDHHGIPPHFSIGMTGSFERAKKHQMID